MGFLATQIVYVLCPKLPILYEEFVRKLPISSDWFPRGLSNCKIRKPFCNISEEKNLS
jgi:hypothetical protein